MLKSSKHSDTSADSFVPLLIYVVLQANPDHLVSNVQYILRFRNQEKLGGETGYYVSSLVRLTGIAPSYGSDLPQLGAIQFIENLDRTVLSISDEEFEQNVEAAVSAMAEPNPASLSRGQHASTGRGAGLLPREEGDWHEAPATPVDLAESHSTDEKGSLGLTGDSAGGTGILRSIQRPLSNLGRMFSDDAPAASASSASR